MNDKRLRCAVGKNFTAQAPDTRSPRVRKADRERVDSHHTAAMQHSTPPAMSAFVDDYPRNRPGVASEYGWLGGDLIPLEPLKRFKKATYMYPTVRDSICGWPVESDPEEEPETSPYTIPSAARVAMLIAMPIAPVTSSVRRPTRSSSQKARNVAKKFTTPVPPVASSCSAVSNPHAPKIAGA